MNRPPLSLAERLRVCWKLLQDFREDAAGQTSARVYELGAILRSDVRATMRGQRVPFPVACTRCGFTHSDDCWIDPCPHCGTIHTGDVACFPRRDGAA